MAVVMTTFVPSGCYHRSIGGHDRVALSNVTRACRSGYCGRRINVVMMGEDNGWKGFGPRPEQSKREKSEGQKKREEASRSYDRMKEAGMPEYNIFVRVKTEDEKPNWFPVGSLCVERSGRITESIFSNEGALLQGAFRLFPKLREHEGNLQYGYQLKEFPDEDIRVAEKPPDRKRNPIVGFFETIMGNPMNTDNLGR
mmetsp:Transcript_5916/g.11678  ORF Transcript_5916/g.11678 Transcript_5916/m.11678 type:complete len:198 (-) Transcript_5916:71-664(-)